MAAPIGNKFALFNNGGAPAKYKTGAELIIVIDEYFNSFKSEDDNPPNPVLGHKPTVTGLALYLGFESRQSLYDYRDRSKEFSYIIKKALTYIEMHYEMLLESKASTGAIFALKNMGWKDTYDNNNNNKTELNITVQDESTKDELNKLINEND